MQLGDVSIMLALVFGLFTAAPGLLPASSIVMVTWSRVVSGIGWVGYGIGALFAGEIPDAMVPGLLVAQVGYAIAVFAIINQPCRK